MNFYESEIIIDEAHHYRNSNTTKYENLSKLVSNVSPEGYIVMMSATPYNNNKDDIYNQLSLLFNKNVLSSKKLYFTKSKKSIAFKKSFTRHHEVIPVTLSNDEMKMYEDVKSWYYKNNIDDDSGFGLNAIEKMATSSLYMVQRYLRESGNIKEKNYIDQESDLDNDETLFFNNMTKLMNKREKKFAISKLEKTTTYLLKRDSKLETLEEKLPEIVEKIKKQRNNGCSDNDNKIIIFTFYVKVAEYLKQELSKQYEVRTLTGNTKEEDRTINFNWFKKKNDNNKVVKILICTDVCKEGIDFQFCSNLINYDLPYNPVTVEQRIGRIDRMGQNNPINIYSMYVENTYDEKLYCILYSKLNEVKFFADRGIGNQVNILVEEFELFKTRIEKWLNEIRNYLDDLKNVDRINEKTRYDGIYQKIKYNLDILNDCFSIEIGKGRRKLNDEILEIKRHICEMKVPQQTDSNIKDIYEKYVECEEEIKNLLFKTNLEKSIKELMKEEIENVIKNLNVKLKKFDTQIEKKDNFIYKIFLSQKLKDFIIYKSENSGQLRYEIRNWFDNYYEWKEELYDRGISSKIELKLKEEITFEYSIGDGEVSEKLFLPLYGEFYKVVMEE